MFLPGHARGSMGTGRRCPGYIYSIRTARPCQAEGDVSEVCSLARARVAGGNVAAVPQTHSGRGTTLPWTQVLVWLKSPRRALEGRGEV